MCTTCCYCWSREPGFHTKAVNRKSCCWFAAAAVAAAAAAHKRERERCKFVHSYFAGNVESRQGQSGRKRINVKRERNAQIGVTSG